MREQTCNTGVTSDFLAGIIKSSKIMSLCLKTFIKLLMEMEVTPEGQTVPSASAECGRTWGGAVWLLAKIRNQILLQPFERK